jgi:mono/diheme cytochrome c family protein
MDSIRTSLRCAGLFSTIGIAAIAGACASSSSGELTAASSSALGASPVPLPVPPTAALQHGQNVWLKATFGGEQFFSLILPAAPFNLPLGIGNVLTTPRAQRFTQWGVVNDPGCTLGTDALGLDVCTPDVSASDPDAPFEGEPSGVVGIRKYPNPLYTGSNPSPTNFPYIFGVACAGCHAGLNAQSPPANPNAPTWDNISLTTGNQFLKVGAIFGANLPQSDPRWQVFHTWAPGTVDTTAIESDGINNPGIITQFFDFPERPYFNVTSSLVDLTTYGDGTTPIAHRAGQGGEDDVGCELAATRVYFNIGMCAADCMIPHLENGPGGSQTPIDLTACAAACGAPFAAQQRDLADECAFINNGPLTPSPKLLETPGGSQYVNTSVLTRGAEVFGASCAGCHSNGQPLSSENNVYSNDVTHKATGYDPLLGETGSNVGTNECRSLTTNWMGGHIWAEFSSDEKKAQGPGYTRDVPLLGVWATAPFFHNNRLGPESADPSVGGRVAAFEAAYEQLVNPWTRNEAGSVLTTTAPVTVSVGTLSLTLPAGTPVDAFANLDTATLTLTCSDFIENGGHYFGALLSAEDKYALGEFLKTL